MPADPATDARRVLAADGDEDAGALAAMERLVAAADATDPDRRRAGLAALFGGVVEPLGDGFAPAGRRLYARYFGHALWQVCAADPELAAALRWFGIDDEAGLLARHTRLRANDARVRDAPQRIAVLSRVTLGADILLTSVLLQRLHEAWPEAELVVLGDAKLAGLIGGLPRVRIEPVAYARRGGLSERVRTWLPLLAGLRRLEPDLVVAPDSRLDQLGLLPTTHAEEAYLLWETLEPEDGPPTGLADLLDAWCRRRLPCTVAQARLPRLAFDAATAADHARLVAALGPGRVAVKLDHGGNPAKALPVAGARHVLEHLRRSGRHILLDRGFGAEELAASDALLGDLGWAAVDLDDSGRGLGRPVADLIPGELASAPVVRFHGSIAGWAAALAACELAFSYDSVGHHLAAASEVPLVTAFTGHTHPVFPLAWRPRGRGPVTVVEIPTSERGDPAHWERVGEALDAMGPADGR